jgi:hypothetical protein
VNLHGHFGLRARTLDFYVAFLVFFLGLSGIVDPTWPERFGDSAFYWIVMVEDIYLMVASATIMLSLILRTWCGVNCKYLIPSVVGETYGWLFISTAAWVIVLSSPWIPPSAVVEAENHLSFVSWIAVWVGLGLSSFLRHIDLKRFYRSGGIK